MGDVGDVQADSSGNGAASVNLSEKAAQLSLMEQKQISEAERLREEIFASRKARQDRATSRGPQSSLDASGGGEASSSSKSGPSTGFIKPSSTSFPVSAGSASPSGAPTSLAHFIGGSRAVNGPVLNKNRPEYQDGAGLETDDLSKPTATFLSKNKDILMQGAHFNREKRFVAMPGMVRPGQTAPAPIGKSQTDPLPALRSEKVDDIAREGSAEERKKSYGIGTSGGSSTSSTLPSMSTSQYGIQRSASPAEMPKPSSPSVSDNKPVGVAARGSSDERQRGYGIGGASSTPAWVSMPKFETGRPSNVAQGEILREGTAEERKRGYGVAITSSNSSSSPAAKQDASPQLSLSPPIATSDVLPSRSPTLPTSLTFNAVSAAKSETIASQSKQQDDSDVTNGRPSVIRLQGSNIVEDRLRWGEAHSSNSSAPASGTKTASNTTSAPPIASPQIGRDDHAKKSSVLDRWGRDSPNQVASVGSSPSRATSLPAPSIGGNSVSSPINKPSLASKPTSLTASFDKLTKSSPSVNSMIEPSATELPKLNVSHLEEQAIIMDGITQKLPMSSTQPTSAKSTKSPQSATSATWPRASSGSPASSKPIGRVGAAVAATSNLPISVSPVPYQRAVMPSSPKMHSTPRDDSQTSSSPSNAFAAARNIFQPSSTSFAVSSGNLPSDGRPTSLAHFIGGSQRVTGPVLNKYRPETMDGAGMETDDFARPTATFMSKNKDEVMKGLQGHHFQRGNKAGVPLPGMVKQTPKAKEEISNKVEEEILPKAPVSQENTVSGREPTSGERLISPLAPSSTIFPVTASPQAGRELPISSNLSMTALPLIAHSGPQSVLANAYAPCLLGQTSTLRQTQASTLVVPIAKPKPTEVESDLQRQHGQLPSGPSPQSKESRLTQDAASSRGMATALRNMLEAPDNLSIQGARDLNADAQRAKADAIMKRFSEAGAMSGSAIGGDDWHSLVNTWTIPLRKAPEQPEASNIHPPSKGTFVVPEPPITELPVVDASIFEESKRTMPSKPKYLSVDVLAIRDNYATTLTPAQASVFHSTEILCIVLRSRQGGLVLTQLLIWHGKHSQTIMDNGPEQQKITELQDRYRTIASHITQGNESDELVAALKDRLIVRHGARSAFDVLNSTMYRVQAIGVDMIVIDEVDMEKAALCSGYSYIVSVFEDLFVWHGVGSSQRERNAAVQFAMELAQDSDSGTRDVSETEEGHESELFKDILGDGDYASAYHWRLRSTLVQRDIRIFGMDKNNKLCLVDTNTDITDLGQRVLLILLPFEAYVVIPSDGRGMRGDIALGIAAGRAYRHIRRVKAPHFVLPVHTLVMPSVIPADLAACFRSSWLNDLNTTSGEFTMNSHVPTTMNIVDDETAMVHLAATSFEREDVVELDTLP